MDLPRHARDRRRVAAPDRAGSERESLTALLQGACGPEAARTADLLLASLGTTADILNASPETLLRLLPEHPGAAEQLGHVRTALEQVLRGRLDARPLLGDEAALVDYLTFTMAHRHSEAIRLLFLDSRNRLIRDELLGMGSVGSVALHPREPVRRALELGATAMILVHNHPSGDPTPSVADIEATRRLETAAALMDIRLHDHLIVARDGWTSLRRLGVLS